MGSTSSKSNDSNGHAYFENYRYDGSQYTGWFDVKNERVILTSDDAQCVHLSGVKYKGGIKDGKPHGTGCFTFKSGNVYEGNFANGVVIGYWMVHYSSGNIYEGGLNGHYHRHGHGKIIYANGDVYEGNWSNNKKHGQGKLIYTDGYVYEGNWSNNERCGQGKMIYTDGGIYEGNWSNNKKHGHGKYICPSGNICDGFWEYDQRNGLFTTHWIDNKYLIDLLKMNNITARGMYVNDKKKGIFHVTGEEDGKKKEYNCKYVNNILVDYKQID